MPVKTVYIFLMILVISIIMGTGYSVFNAKLTINGTAVAQYQQQEIEVPSQGQDENGVDRFTVSSTVENMLGMEILRVTKEETAGNSITTTMQVVSTLSIFGSSLEINLEIRNGSKYTFSNGTIEIIESVDTERAFSSTTQKLSTPTLEPGEATTATISGTVYTRRIQTGTYYKYKISFDTEEGTKDFYYTLKLEP